MRMRSLRTASVRNQRVLVRVDLNIATNRRGQLRDQTRLNSILPTVHWLVKHGASVILLSHRGRPTKPNQRDSLRPIVAPLRRLLKQPIRFITTPPQSPATQRALATLQPGQIALLENLRFSPGEDRNTATFARQLAKLGDVYVNEAFAASHRTSASIVRLPKLLPSYAGLWLQQEVDQLSKLMQRPRRPYVAILGGAKISTKLKLVKRLLKQADHVLLGGALANTVLKAEGLAIGASLSEPSMLRQARGLSVNNKHLHVPCDVVVVRGHVHDQQRAWVRPVGWVAREETIADIGPDTVELYSRIIRSAATIVWNGPMGVYEHPPFDRGTRAIARMVAKAGAKSIAGGGETVDAVAGQKLAKKFDWLSTGGGAMLEFLEGKHLPGLQALATRR